MQLLIPIAAFIFGTLIGSFLNVLILRLPNDESIGGRSHCTHCGVTLKARHLVPVFSYLWLRGKCVGCRRPISARYMVIELVTAILFAFVAWRFIPHDPVEIMMLLRALFIASILIVVFVVDWEHYVILDKVVLPAVVVVFAFNIVIDVMAKHVWLSLGSLTITGLVGAAVASGFFWLIWRVSNGRWMGFGDVKLALVLGAALGLPVVVFCLFLSFLLGAVAAVPLLVLGKKQMTSSLPFGTFLALAAFISLAYGHELVGWYARLIGLA